MYYSHAHVKYITSIKTSITTTHHIITPSYTTYDGHSTPVPGPEDCTAKSRFRLSSDTAMSVSLRHIASHRCSQASLPTPQHHRHHSTPHNTQDSQAHHNTSFVYCLSPCGAFLPTIRPLGIITPYPVHVHANPHHAMLV